MNQCLAAFPSWRVVSSGKLLWNWVAHQGQEGQVVQELMKQGELVPNEVVLDLLMQDISRHKSNATTIIFFSESIEKVVL